MSQPMYALEKGVRVLRVVEVRTAEGTMYRSGWCTRTGAQMIFTSPALPLRSTRGEAQADLNAYADRHRLQQFRHGISLEKARTAR